MHSENRRSFLKRTMATGLGAAATAQAQGDSVPGSQGAAHPPDPLGDVFAGPAQLDGARRTHPRGGARCAARCRPAETWGVVRAPAGRDDSNRKMVARRRLAEFRRSARGVFRVELIAAYSRSRKTISFTLSTGKSMISCGLSCAMASMRSFSIWKLRLGR